MAREGNLKSYPGEVAAGDLSADQYKFVTLGASGASLNTVNGGYVDGILQNDPAAAGRGATVAYDGVSKVVAGAAVLNGAKLMSDATGRAVTATTVASSASKTCAAENYRLDAGDTIVLGVDAAGDATITWDAAAATIVDTTSYAVTDQIGLTSIVTLTGGPYDGIAQTVTFAGATTTAAHVAAEMNAQLNGCSVAAGAQVTITHDGQGTDMDITVTAGTGNLTWAASTAGTGDVADITAVTAAEVEARIEADSTALVTVATGVPTIFSPTTGTSSELDFVSGLALTKLGLGVEAVFGAASDATIRGRARDAASAAGEIITMTLAPASKV